GFLPQASIAGQRNITTSIGGWQPEFFSAFFSAQNTMNKILLFLLPVLIAADLPGTRVTVNGPPRPVTELAPELGRKANVRIEVDKAATARVDLSLNGIPFWDALEQLAAKSNHRLSVGPQGPRVALGSGPYRPIPHVVRGPFRFAARHVRSRIDLE